MDFLNKAWAQVADLFRSMSPGARITSALLLAVVVVSLAFLFKSQSFGPDVYLMNGEHFSPSEMEAMLGAFGKANLDSYEVEGTRVRIPRSQQGKYLTALVDGNALPGNYFSYIDKANDGGSILDSPQVREQKQRTAKQKLLSEVIGAMQGIESAVVLYDSDVKGGSLKKEKIFTASVSVKPKGSEQLNEQQVYSIRRLVAGAVAGMDAERVTVADLNSGKTFYGSPEGGMGSAMDDIYGQRKRMYEQDWTAKVLSALAHIPGVSVAANVELDPTQDSREEQVHHETKTVPFQVTEKTSSRTMDGSGPGGRVGAVAQTANAPASLNVKTAKGSHEEEEQSEQTTVNAVPGKRTEKRTHGLTPQRVAVAVNIPTSYFKKVWLERNPPDPAGPPKTPDPKDLDPIRKEVIASTTKQVATLIPQPAGVADKTELVTVTEVQDIVSPAPPEPDAKQQAMGWLAQNWSTLAVAVVALACLMMLRSMLRATPAESAPLPVMQEAQKTEAETPDGQSEDQPAPRLKRARKPGVSLRDELTSLVSEDPDAAANILRSWIGNAS